MAYHEIILMPSQYLFLILFVYIEIGKCALCMFNLQFTYI